MNHPEFSIPFSAFSRAFANKLHFQSKPTNLLTLRTAVNK